LVLNERVDVVSQYLSSYNVVLVSLVTLGWHNWYVLPPSNTATLLIILNLLTILMSTLILHLSFFGRLLALYKRNYHRVECLTQVSMLTFFYFLHSQLQYLVALCFLIFLLSFVLYLTYLKYEYELIINSCWARQIRKNWTAGGTAATLC